MKTLRKVITVTVLGAAFAFAQNVLAESAVIGEHTWSYSVSGGNATITGVSPATGDIAIPAKIGGYDVTSIGDNAFYKCADLGNIIIPDSVACIGNEAFSCCSRLASVIIPDSVINIGRSVFQDCESLANVTIGNGVTNMGEYAFQDCTALTNVTIGCNMTRIDYGTFLHCTNLTSVAIPDHVTSIGSYAFMHCYALETITIPDSVTNVEYEAFGYCNGIRDATVPQCVCSNKLSSVFPSAYQDMTNVTISAGVSAIGDDAFRDCDGLEHVTIPGGVKIVGYSAFRDCDNLKSVTIQDGVVRLDACAFMDCKALSAVTIPDSMRSVENIAFVGCNPALFDSVTIGGFTLSLVDGWAVEPWSGVPFEGDVEIAGIRGIGDHLLSPAPWTHMRISGCTAIGNYVFYNNILLESVKFDSHIKAIGECAFGRCRKLKRVVFEGDAPHVEPWSFYSVPGDCVVYIPQGNATYDVHDGRWQGMLVRYFVTDKNLDVGGKGSIEKTDGGYRVTAFAGETLTELDFAFPAGREIAYAVTIASDGKSATVVLKPPFEVEKSEDVADEPWAENGDGTVTINIEVVPGLYYAATSAASLDALSCPGADTPATDGTKLVVEKPDSGTQGFYQVWVSETPLRADE